MKAATVAANRPVYEMSQHIYTAEMLGGLEPLIRQMLSPNVEVQCNAVGCVTNLATHGMFSAVFGCEPMTPT